MAHHHRHGPTNQLPLTDFTIFPPIGIARVGNSPDGWFYGPEIPDRLYATPPPPENPDYYREPAFFKDDNGAIKRQVKFFFFPVTFHDLIFKPCFDLVRPLDSEFLERIMMGNGLKPIRRTVMSSFGKSKLRTRKPLGTISGVGRNFTI